jgi:hypothetical protein
MRLVRVAAAVLAGAAVLTGCSDRGTANETLPSSSTTAAPTSAALQPLGPPDLPMPKEAREPTAAGAESFLRYYVDLMNNAQRDSTSKYIRDLSKGCDTCSSFADGVDNYAAQQYHYSGGAILLNAASPPSMDDVTAEFSISLTQEALTVVGPDQLPVPELEAAEATYSSSGATSTWDPDRSTWIMTTLTIA